MTMNEEFFKEEIKKKEETYKKLNGLENQFREAKTRVFGQIEYLEELLKNFKELNKTQNG